MAQAIMDPEKVRRFAEELQRFNSDIENRLVLLHARFAALGDTWSDQEHEKFSEEFKQALKALKKFVALSKEQTTDSYNPGPIPAGTWRVVSVLPVGTPARGLDLTPDGQLLVVSDLWVLVYDIAQVTHPQFVGPVFLALEGGGVAVGPDRHRPQQVGGQLAVGRPVGEHHPVGRGVRRSAEIVGVGGVGELRPVRFGPRQQPGIGFDRRPGA